MRVGEYRVGEKFWKASHKAFYCNVVHPGGRAESRRLDPDEEKAEVRRAEVVASIRNAGTPSPDFAVRALCNLFLAYSEANNSKATYTGYRCYLKSFSASIPATLRVRDLKAHHVHNWLTRRYPATGNTNTRHGAVCCVKRVFNWALDMEYLDKNPLARLKAPPTASRAVCPSKAQWDEVLTHFKPDDPFHDFLQFLLHTGCRPQEARLLEARHIEWQDERAHFEDGEVPGKKGERDIVLTDEALAILRKWALKNPEGPVFRNEDGNPWKPNALRCRLARLQKTKKIDFRVFCYAARHSVATEMLASGSSTGAVAAVLGHTDPTMVLTVYGRHIDKREKHLRECLKKATG